VFAEIDTVQRRGATDVELTKIKQTFRRGRETSLKENDFWLGAITDADQRGRDPRELLVDWRTKLDALDSDVLREVAKKFLVPDQYVKVSLLPEK
jgi:zinc protease